MDATPHPAHAHRHITTASGRTIPPPPAFSASHVHLRDIAHSLAQQTRYLGHLREFYSVAEHSVLCARLALHHRPGNRRLAWAALIHDAHEAYIGDLPSPWKLEVPGWALFERRFETTVRLALKAPRPSDSAWGLVRGWDIDLLHAEMWALGPNPAPAWLDRPRGMAASKIAQPVGVPPDRAAALFIEMAAQLGHSDLTAGL